jgi:hypothetical protein
VGRNRNIKYACASRPVFNATTSTPTVICMGNYTRNYSRTPQLGALGRRFGYRQLTTPQSCICGLFDSFQLRHSHSPSNSCAFSRFEFLFGNNNFLPSHSPFSAGGICLPILRATMSISLMYTRSLSIIKYWLDRWRPVVSYLKLTKLTFSHRH